MLRIARNKYRRCGQTGGILKLSLFFARHIAFRRAWNCLEWVAEQARRYTLRVV